GGTVMELFHLVRELGTRHPIYGLQSPGFDGVSEPVTSVEDTADLYLSAMRKLQPRGPYALIGYSFGGLVMLEIAQRLGDNGEKVALLTMLETFPDMTLLPRIQRLSLFASRAKRH